MRHFDYILGDDVPLSCHMEASPPDRGCGYDGGVSLCAAYLGGHDIAAFLSPDVIDEIECAAYRAFFNV